MNSNRLVVFLGGSLFAAQSFSADAGVDDRLRRLEQQLESQAIMVERLQQLTAEVQGLRGQMEQQDYEIRRLKDRQKSLYLDIDQRLGATPAHNPVSLPASSDQKDVSPAVERQAEPGQPEELIADSAADPEIANKAYQDAFNLLKQGYYDDAIGAFRAYLQTYPAADHADRAQYWIAEALYVNRKYAAALEDFRYLLEQYPDSRKLPDALLKIGYIHYEAGRWQSSKESLQQLVSEHPVSAAARLAEKRLERIHLEGH